MHLDKFWTGVALNLVKENIISFGDGEISDWKQRRYFKNENDSIPVQFSLEMARSCLEMLLRAEANYVLAAEIIEDWTVSVAFMEV